MTFREEAIKGLSWSFLIQIGFQSINFVGSIFLARILLPEEFGLIGMIAIFIALGRILIDGGLTSSLIRSKNLDDADYSTVFYMNLIISIIIYFIVYFFAPLIAFFFEQPILIKIIRIISLVFIINAFSAVQSTRLNKNLQFKTQFKLIISALLISNTISIWMATAGYGVWSLVTKDILFSSIATIQLWIYSKWIPSLQFSKTKLKYHFNFGFKLTLTGLLDTIVNNLYNILIGKYFSAAQLGYYSRAKTMQELPTTSLIQAFNRVAFPLLSKINDDDDRLKSAYKTLMVQVVFWIVPILAIFGTLATPIFRILLTDKWLPAVPFFQILVLAGLFLPLHKYNLNICYVKGRSDIVLKLSIIQNILTIIGAISAIWFGIYGLLWSIVSVNILVTFINAHQSGNLINYTLFEQIKDVAPIYIFGTITALISYGCDKFLFPELSDLLRILFSGIIAFSTYLLLSFIFKSPALHEITTIIKSRF